MGKENDPLRLGREDMNPDWNVQSRQPGYRLEKLNTLAYGKGDVPTCEITGLSAGVKMITPYITLYFSTREDAKNGWRGIMYKLCPLLGPLRSRPPIVGSEEERARRKRTLDISLRALIDLTKAEASASLEGRRYALAIPAAIQTLKFASEVHGASSGHPDVVSAYLLLGEAHLGLANINEAEDYLSKANVGIMRYKDEVPNRLNARMHRAFGKLFLSKRRHVLALKHAATAVYHTSLDVGPEHIETSFAYFDCAAVFFEMRRIEQGLAFYDKVVDIWYKYLAALSEDDDDDDVSTTQDHTRHAHLKMIEAAREMLTKVYDARRRLLGDTHIATGEASYTLGLLYMFLGDSAQGRKWIGLAHDVSNSQLGSEHPSTKDIARALSEISVTSS